MSLKQRVKALERSPRDREYPPHDSRYWTENRRMVWELNHNPHLDPKVTLANEVEKLESFYN